MTTGTHCSGPTELGSRSGESNSFPLWLLLFTLAHRAHFESRSRKRFSVPAKVSWCNRLIATVVEAACCHNRPSAANRLDKRLILTALGEGLVSMRRGWSMPARLAILVVFAVVAILRTQLRIPFLALVALGLIIAAGLRLVHRNSL
jgi:hypothetical protein